jgi:hypothetical protein
LRSTELGTVQLTKETHFIVDGEVRSASPSLPRLV